MAIRRVTFLVHDDELGGDGTRGRPYHTVLNVYTEEGRQVLRVAVHPDADPSDLDPLIDELRTRLAGGR
jgi:hypothetical protein